MIEITTQVRNKRKEKHSLSLILVIKPSIVVTSPPNVPLDNSKSISGIVTPAVSDWHTQLIIVRNNCWTALKEIATTNLANVLAHCCVNVFNFERENQKMMNKQQHPLKQINKPIKVKIYHLYFS